MLIFGAGSPVVIAFGIAMILKAFPGTQELPAWTPAWLFTWYIENHPSRGATVIEEIARVEAFRS
jgi:hypothetical protein